MRGKGQIHQRIDHGLGITPACAGKSQILMDTAELEVDHPRVCGEKPSFALTFQANEGSPPRVRGKAIACMQGIKPTRITPACAGKRYSRA